MGSLSIWHWLIVGGVALLLFGGKGKISDIMGDVAKGIKSFKKGLSEDDEAKAAAGTAAKPAEPVKTIDHQASATVDKAAETHKA
jgi:sec-independent protein translocase protein TatA